MPAQHLSRHGERDAGPALPGHRMLLVADDRETAAVWAYALRQLGLEATYASSAAVALECWPREAYELVVIDVTGPDLDGVELVRRLRVEAANPILLITPRGDEPHLLHAYHAGADECLVKPISPALLLAKVRAWLRRTWTVPAGALNHVESGALSLDPARRELALPDGSSVRLTNLEFRLLYTFMSHAGQVLSADAIIDHVWGYSGGGDSVLLKNLVYRLRHKIEPEPGAPRFIQTIGGAGYTFTA